MNIAAKLSLCETPDRILSPGLEADQKAAQITGPISHLLNQCCKNNICILLQLKIILGRYASGIFYF